MKWLLGLLGLWFIFGRSNSSASNTHSGGSYDDQSHSNHFYDDLEDDDYFSCNDYNDSSSCSWSNDDWDE